MNDISTKVSIMRLAVIHKCNNGLSEINKLSYGFKLLDWDPF